MALPALRFDQHDPCRLYEQDRQIAIAPPGDLAEDRAVSRRDLFGNEPQPCGEVAAFGERIEALAGEDVGCERLMSVPGIGPIISGAMVSAIGTGVGKGFCLVSRSFPLALTAVMHRR